MAGTHSGGVLPQSQPVVAVGDGVRHIVNLELARVIGRLASQGFRGSLALQKADGGVVLERVCVGTQRVLLHAFCRDLAHVAGAEVGNFVHVNPQAVERQLVVPLLQMVLPPLLCSRVRKVGVVRRARPYLADVGLAGDVFEEHVLGDAVVVGGFPRLHLDARVHYGHPPLSPAVQLLHPSLEPVQRELDRVNREVLPPIHVVNVGPHGFKWDGGGGVVGYHLLHLIDGLIPPLALVEAQAPVGRHVGPPHQAGELLQHGGGGGPAQHPQIHHPPDCPPRDALHRQRHLHAVAVQQHQPVRRPVRKHHHDEWMGAIEVGVRIGGPYVTIP
mmetsp:Transcript_397/g.1181  ORF Transcript_397/g.1181 Transcript_397/m.1181 type:complete len:330 (-) Transcript_397:766-1755(-)